MQVKKNTIRSILTHYHIIDRDNRPTDDDEESGSTSYPSRTTWGAGYSLAEKYNFLFERKFFIRAFDYWWGYTSAQIDLMISDVPLVVYKSANTDNNHTADEMAEIQQRWLESRKQGSLAGKTLTLNDILNGNEE